MQLFGRLGDDLLVDGPFNDLLNGEGGTDTINCPNGGTNVSRQQRGRQLLVAARREGRGCRRAGLARRVGASGRRGVPGDRLGGGRREHRPSGTQIIYTGSASADSVIVDDAGINSYTFAENGITASSASCTLDTAPNPDVVTCSGS